MNIPLKPLDHTLAKLAPPIAEAMAKRQMGRQQRQEAPHAREGTLYRGGESDRIYGRGSENAADRKAAMASNTTEAGKVS